MRRKAIAALGMAVLMTVGTCVPVLAENTTGGSTTVSYTQNPVYTVTIPATVTAGTTEQTFNIGLDTTADYFLEGGSTIGIAIAGVTDGKLSLKTAKDDSIEVDVTEPDAKTLDLTTTSREYKIGAVSNTAHKAGTFSGTLTFTLTYTAPV